MRATASAMRLVFAVVAMLLAALGADGVRAQPAKSARVGVLASSTQANFEPSVKVLREGLRSAGWVEGQNLTVFF